MAEQDGLSTYKGPRRTVTVRVSAESVLILEAAAAGSGVSRSALLARLLESYAEAWMRANADAIAEEQTRRMERV